jgi:hypothetical protein
MRKESKVDVDIETELLNDVMNVKGGSYLDTKTSLGRWYALTLITIVCFPVIGWAVRKFTSSIESETNILITIGYIVIIGFITGIIFARKK